MTFFMVLGLVNYNNPKYFINYFWIQMCMKMNEYGFYFIYKH